MDNIRRKIDNLFRRIDELAFQEKFDEIDEFIDEFDVENSCTYMCVAILSITSAPSFFGMLESRKSLVKRVESRLLDIAPDRVDSLMKNLRD